MIFPIRELLWVLVLERNQLDDQLDDLVVKLQFENDVQMVNMLKLNVLAIKLDVVMVAILLVAISMVVMLVREVLKVILKDYIQEFKIILGIENYLLLRRRNGEIVLLMRELMRKIRIQEYGYQKYQLDYQQN